MAPTSAFFLLKASFTSGFNDLFWTKWECDASKLFQQREGFYLDFIGTFSEYCENYRELSLTAPVYEYHFPRAVQTPTIVIGFKTVKISQRPHQPWDGFYKWEGSSGL